MLTDLETVRNSLQQHGRLAQLPQAPQSDGAGLCIGCECVPFCGVADTTIRSHVVSHRAETSRGTVHARAESQGRTRCTSRGFSVTGLRASTTRGPIVMLGTNRPSMTSMCTQSHPASSIALTCITASPVRLWQRWIWEKAQAGSLGVDSKRGPKQDPGSPA